MARGAGRECGRTWDCWMGCREYWRGLSTAILAEKNKRYLALLIMTTHRPGSYRNLQRSRRNSACCNTWVFRATLNHLLQLLIHSTPILRRIPMGLPTLFDNTLRHLIWIRSTTH